MNRFFTSVALFFVGITAITSWESASLAASKKGVYQPSDFKIEGPEDDYPYMSDEEYTAFKKVAVKKSASRVPSTRLDFADPNVKFTSEYLNLQAKLIGGPVYDKNGQKTGNVETGVRDADGLAALIDKADDDAYYATLPNDAKFIVAALASMKPYRGFAFRARRLFDANNFVHAIAIAGLRFAATGINVFLPTPQWKAGFQYFTEPLPVKYQTLTAAELKELPKSSRERATSYIVDEYSFFNFVNFEVLPAVSKYSIRLQNLVKASENGDFKPFYFDNQLVISTANFVDDHDRILKIGGPELRLLLASTLASRSGLYASLAYSWTNLFQAFSGVAQNIGFQTVFNVDLTTAQARNKKLAQAGLFLLQSPKKMALAYDALKESVLQSDLAWKEIKASMSAANRVSDLQIAPLLDPRAFAPFTRSIDASVSTMVSLFEPNQDGKVQSAVVAGESVQVDLYKFFHGDTIPTDLKKFMPTSYVPGPKVFTSNSGSREGELAKAAGGPLRNYLEGSPATWDLNLYRVYFPSLKNERDVQNAARILTQAWGGWVIGMPMSAMVL